MIRCERDQRIQGSQRIREKANEACCKFESEQKVSLGFRGCKLLMTAICVRVKLKDSDRVTILLQMASPVRPLRHCRTFEIAAGGSLKLQEKVNNRGLLHDRTPHGIRLL